MRRVWIESGGVLELEGGLLSQVMRGPGREGARKPAREAGES